ncbi:MAG TPA: DNA helicase, partial [Polyangiaceae bacterium]
MAQVSPLSLTAAEYKLIADEEALLECTLRAIDAAPRPAADKRVDTTAELRALRDAAIAAPEDDLPALMHELSVRQTLAARPPTALPDRDTPYLAHLVLLEGRQTRDYLLGHANFFDLERGVRIIDWRVAPVAKIYYNYAEGDEYEEELPGRTATGVVLARRIVVIEKARVKLILTREHVLRHTATNG